MLKYVSAHWFKPKAFKSTQCTKTCHESFKLQA